MNRHPGLIAVVAALFVTTTTAGGLAHHSYGVYDSSNPVTLTGVIRDVTYEHPHVELRLDVQGRMWTLDLPAPSRARARGLTPEFLQIGRTITVVGWPHRNGTPELAPTQITFEGTTIRVRS